MSNRSITRLTQPINPYMYLGVEEPSGLIKLMEVDDAGVHYILQDMTLDAHEVIVMSCYGPDGVKVKLTNGKRYVIRIEEAA